MHCSRRLSFLFLSSFFLLLKNDNEPIIKHYSITHDDTIHNIIDRINSFLFFILVPDFRNIQFNSERFVPGHYRIYNYRQRAQLTSLEINASPYEYVSVGEWKINHNDQGQLNLPVDSIVWPGSNYQDNTIPISRCSEPCRTGEVKQFQGDSCCWVCTPCNETSIVTGPEEQERCEQCSMGYWPTSNRTTCYKLKETYIGILSAQGLIPISLSIIGNLLTLFVVYTFLSKTRNTCC